MLFDLIRNEREIDRISKILKKGAWLNDKEFFEMEIRKWKLSKERQMQITGNLYFKGVHDILKRERTAIGKDGKLETVTNLPNNKIVDNQYAKIVAQKVNYIVGKPITFDTENEKYQEELTKLFNRRFHSMINNVCEDVLNCGIGYIYPYFDDKGQLKLKRFDPYEILPFWKDAEHTELDCFARVFKAFVYEGKQEHLIERVELYFVDRIERYYLTDTGSLIPEPDNFVSDYIILEDETGAQHGYNWGRVPLIPFKYNNKETPLIAKVKSIQDALNAMLSDFANNMQEDSRNTILVIKNYDGANLAELRHNLATYGAVKVKTIDGADGGVETLQISVNADNYKAIVDVLKKSLIENAMAYDAKDARLSGNPNQMNIQSMFMDIDLDANGMETEFQASFESLLWFANVYFVNAKKGDFFSEKVEVIFNRDMLMNESEIIQNCKNSIGILSNETIVAQHPWVNDIGKELEKKKEEQLEGFDEYQGAFLGGGISEE